VRITILALAVMTFLAFPHFARGGAEPHNASPTAVVIALSQAVSALDVATVKSLLFDVKDSQESKDLLEFIESVRKLQESAKTIAKLNAEDLGEIFPAAESRDEIATRFKDAVEKVDGNAATVTVPRLSAATVFNLRKVGNEWKLERQFIDEQGGLVPGRADQPPASIPYGRMAKEFRRINAILEKGKLDGEALKEAISAGARNGASGWDRLRG
jgi:hypothetical protein